MTTYTGPYGFRWHNQRTGTLTNDSRVYFTEPGPWQEYPEGDPPRDYPAVIVTQDGELVDVRYALKFETKDAIDAEFVVTEYTTLRDGSCAIGGRLKITPKKDGD